ncbi:hypothetical protein Vadar_004112 [Vaccinium darrowii]|nr:hypothetical protein Vadar_004112 [Vaccinium darrowii]
MTTKHSLLLSLLFFFLHRSQAQDFSPNTTGYPCPANQSSVSTYPCKTYAFYRASAPNFLDLRSIAYLFSVTPVQIAEASNITFSYDILAPNQPLFVPISCSCNSVAGNLTPNSNASLSYNEFNPSPNTTTSISYANIPYTIGAGDTLFLVSVAATFQNLTTYYSVEIVNPDLVPTNLSIVATANVPVFCKCPNRNQSNFLITYVIQPEDYLTSVASFFGSSANSIVEVNGNNFEPYTTIFIPVSRLPVLSQTSVVTPVSSVLFLQCGVW